MTAVSWATLTSPETFLEVYRRSPDGVVITDSAPIIVDVNPAYERISGYSREELLGQNPRILRSGKTPAAVYREMWETLRAKGAWQGTFINRRKGGQEYYAFFSTVALGDPARPLGYVGFMRDITPMVEGERELARRLEELRRTQRVTVHALALVAEHRDPGVVGHLRRVWSYSLLLAEALREEPWDTRVDDAFIEGLGYASLLHDLGKVGIPEGILFKPGPLNPLERALVELHPLIGADILRKAEEELRAEIELPETFLTMATQVALYHHERWDGTGYPERLKGTAIPPAARIVALADVYDALTTRRVYKDPVSLQEAGRLVRAQAGAHFDPRVVAAFERREKAFHAVAKGEV